MKALKVSRVFHYSSFNPSVRWGLGSQRHAPAVLTLEKRPGTQCTGGFVGLKASLEGCGKSPLAGFDTRTVQPVASHCTDYAYFEPCQKQIAWNCTLFWSHKGAVLCVIVRASTSNLISIVDWGSLEVKVAQKTETYEAPTSRVDTVLFVGTSDLMRKGGEYKYRQKEINADKHF